MSTTFAKSLMIGVALVVTAAILSGSAIGQKTRPTPVTSPAEAAKEYFHIEGCGMLKTGVTYTLTANDQTWELHLKSDRLRKSADELNGKCTYVTGTPVFQRYPSRGMVPTIVVESVRIGKPMQPMGN